MPTHRWWTEFTECRLFRLRSVIKEDAHGKERTYARFIRREPATLARLNTDGMNQVKEVQK